MLNWNIKLKNNTEGLIQRFLICHFNDLMCPLLFISYSNMLLITVNKELTKLTWIMVLGIFSGLVWEFVAPVIKPSAVIDVIDLLFYALGTFLYWCIIKINCLFTDRRMKYDKNSKLK